MALTKVTNIVHEITNLGVEGGSVCYFYQDTAPTGWTIVDTVTDKVIGLKGGSLGETGGTTTGTWTVADHTHAGATHTHAGATHAHSTSAVALTTSQLPAHSHSGSAAAGGSHSHTVPAGTYTGEGSYGSIIQLGGTSTTTNKTTSTAANHTHTISLNNTGSGATHTHGNTGSATGTTGSATGTTGGGGGTSSYRPATAVGILAEKDGAVEATTWYGTMAGGTAWNYWQSNSNANISSTLITATGPEMAIEVHGESNWAPDFRPTKIRITGSPEGTGSNVALADVFWRTIAGPELPATVIEMNITWGGMDMDVLYLEGMSSVTEIEFDVDPGGPYGV